MNLYEIKQRYLAALDAITVNEETGEVDNADALLEVSGELTDKLENTALYLKNLSADISARQAEIKNQQGILEREQKRYARLSALVSEMMRLSDMPKLRTPRCEVRFITSTSVEVIDPSLLPEKYISQTVTSKPDKRAIKDAIIGGTPIPGAVLVKKPNIQIR